MPEIKDLLEEQKKAFEEFKKANDECLAAKAEGKAVSEMESKVATINETITRLSAEMEDLVKKNLPSATTVDPQVKADAEHKSAWLKWVRKGIDDGLAEMEKKSVSVGTPEDGGFALPIEQDKSILHMLHEQSPMRQICRVVRMGTPEYRKLVNTGGTASGWVGEKDARPETETSKLTQLKPVMGEIYANPAVTQTALDDLFYDVAGELTKDIALAFADAEAEAFVSGDGTNKPKGILAYPQAEQKDDTRPFGTLETIKTGVAGGFKTATAAVNPADDLITLIHALKGGYRQRAKFVVSNEVLALIRAWKDMNGAYIWQPALQAGQPSTLMGYGVVENNFLPEVGAGAIPLMFGDFQSAYWIFDRIGIRSLRDPYTNKPYVHFYTTKRVGSMLVDSQAVKLLKLAA